MDSIPEVVKPADDAIAAAASAGAQSEIGLYKPIFAVRRGHSRQPEGGHATGTERHTHTRLLPKMADAPGNLHALEDAAYTRALRDLPQPETSLLMPSQKSCLELRRLYPDYRPPTVHDLERRGGSSAPLAKYMWKAFIADRLKNLEAMGDDGIDPANVKLGVADESHDVRFATPPLSARTRTCLLSVRRKAYAAGVDGRRWATLTRHAPPRTAAGDGGRSSGSRE